MITSLFENMKDKEPMQNWNNIAATNTDFKVKTLRIKLKN
jgi:hypothetical protein